MRTLYHFSLHPASRQARIALAEKKLKVIEKPINPWQIDADDWAKFEDITPEGMPPTLTDVRAGRETLSFHLGYLCWMLEQRDWLAGRYFSLGDVAAAAHISCLDFLDEINWRDWPTLKEWYQKVKSRPSMQPLLKDKLPGFRPPRHYTNLDF